ncbi:MAG: hypothetical protein LBG83_07785 [Oscillospiraceae bacterium]|jgi:hypothetical protein|nr:hypothetical protein [Oscillospiraceae bacterium]
MKVNQPNKNLARRALSLCAAAALLFASLPFVLQRPRALTLTPYTDWKQTDSQWASKLLYNKTVRESGCLAVATAILAVHAGLKDGASFDPGQFVDSMRSKGGFTNNNDMVWSVVPTVVPGLTITTENAWMALSGSESSKAAQLQSYLQQGYYIAVSVKSGSHWVALRSVSGGVCTMMDPAGASTNLFATYPASGVYRVALFRAQSSGGLLSNLGNVISNLSELVGLGTWDHSADLPASDSEWVDQSDSDIPPDHSADLPLEGGAADSSASTANWFNGLFSGTNFLLQGWNFLKALFSWMIKGMTMFNTMLSPY